jgi:hypothetical protein
MFWWLKEILSCMKFIAITGSKGFFRSKRIYEFVIPCVATLIAATLYLTFPNIVRPGFLRNFSASVFQVMVFVVPFHLAALAALSTYQAAGLNDKLPGSEAQIRLWSNTDNDYFFHQVTLRQYASLLFGYLCSVGIVYVLGYILVSGIDLTAAAGAYYHTVYKAVLFCSFFFVFHYVTLTIYAVAFLFDKVNKIHVI